MRLFAAIIAGSALLLATAMATATATAAPRTISWSNGKVTSIGALKITRQATIGAAARAFGRPSSRRLNWLELCVVDWRSIGLRGYFDTLDLTPSHLDDCSPGVGKLQSVTIRGAGFRTQRGLKVGDSVARMRELHPGVRLRGSAWWLADAPHPYGRSGERMAIVLAKTQRRRVVNFEVWVGAAEE